MWTQGDFFALLGPNGAGKSTLIGIISSLVQQDRRHGGGVRPERRDAIPTRTKLDIGVVPQEINFNMFEKAFDHRRQRRAGFYGVPREAGAGAGREIPEAAAACGTSARAWRARCPAA